MAGMGDLAGKPIDYATFALNTTNKILDASAATITAVLTPGDCTFEPPVEVSTLKGADLQLCRNLQLGLKKDSIYTFRSAVLVKGKFSLTSDKKLMEMGSVDRKVTSQVKKEASQLTARGSKTPEAVALDRAKALYIQKKTFLFEKSGKYVKAKALSAKLKDQAHAKDLEKWRKKNSGYDNPIEKINAEFSTELRKTLDDIKAGDSVRPDDVETWENLTAEVQTKELATSFMPDLCWPYVVDYEVWSVDQDDATERLSIIKAKITEDYTKKAMALHDELVAAGTRFKNTFQAIEGDVRLAEKGLIDAKTRIKNAQAQMEELKVKEEEAAFKQLQTEEKAKHEQEKKQLEKAIEEADAEQKKLELKRSSSSQHLESLKKTEQAIEKATEDGEKLAEEPKESQLDLYNKDVAAVEQMLKAAGFDLATSIKDRMQSLISAHDAQIQQVGNAANKLAAQVGTLKFIRNFNIRAAASFGDFQSKVGTATAAEVNAKVSPTGSNVVVMFSAKSITNPKIKNITWGDAVKGEITFKPDGEATGNGDPIGMFFNSHL